MGTLPYFATPLKPEDLSIGGPWGDAVRGTCSEWALHVNDDLLLDGFRKRPGIQAWQGEHIGKFLLGSIPMSAIIDSEELRAKNKFLAEALVASQEEDGYLGTYATDRRWYGADNLPDELRTEAGWLWHVWDAWVHKYSMLSLLAYHHQTGWEPALQAAIRAADLIIDVFGPDGEHDINVTAMHKGLAGGSNMEPMMEIYRHTGNEKYLEFCRFLIFTKWEEDSGPRIMPVLRERADVHSISNGKGYEMMSCFVGLLEYARTTGEVDYVQMVLDARDRLADGHRYPTGGMSNNEFFWAPGLLPEWGSVETCVTFTWMELNLRLYELTGDERALDLAEEAYWNQLLPAFTPTYDNLSFHVAMNGPKRFFIGWFHGLRNMDNPYPGASMSCCHTNGQRGLVLLPMYAYHVTNDGALAVNFYGESGTTLELPGVGNVAIAQDTEFPCSDDVSIRVTPEGEGEFELSLRRPPWAHDMQVEGGAVSESGRRIRVRCSGATTVRVSFGMSPHVILCGHEARGKCVLAYGPLIMAMDKPPAGLELDQVVLNLGQGDVAQNMSMVMDGGWPAIDVPIKAIAAGGVAAAVAEDAGTLRLRPVVFAGIKDNPSLTEVIDGRYNHTFNQPQLVEEKCPMYRVQLPFFWVPE